MAIKKRSFFGEQRREETISQEKTSHGQSRGAKTERSTLKPSSLAFAKVTCWKFAVICQESAEDTAS